MRFKVELASADGIRPLLITAEATATVSDVAATIRSGRLGSYAPNDGSLTLELLSNDNVGLRILPPRALLTEEALHSGQRIRVVPWVESSKISALSVPARLRVISGPNAGASFPLRPGPNVIGRGDDCDVVLDDRQVSRRHARVNIGTQIEVVDMHSANGVILSEEKVEQAQLGPRTTVLIGSTTFIVERTASEEPLEGVSTVFNRSPQVRIRYEGKEFQAPEAPSNASGQRFPLVAMVAPLLMGAVMFAVTRNIMSIIFIALSPLIALGTYIDSKVSTRRSSRDEETRFSEDLAQLRQELAEALDEERNVRREETPRLDAVVEAGFSLSPRLWYRHPEDEDYLELNLGFGRAPSRNTLTLPTRRNADADTWAQLTELEERIRLVEDVPITARLSECENLGIAGPEAWRLPIARGIIAQLVCLHSPAELVLAAIASADSSANWGHLMWLPHVASPYSPIVGPHLAAGPAAVSALVSAFEEIVAARKEKPTTMPTMVLLVEDDAPVERGRLVSIAEDGPEVGVHLIWLADSQALLPAACSAFLVREEDGEVNASFVAERKVTPISQVENLSEQMAEDLARQLAPIEDAGAPVIDQSGIPRSVSYLALAGTELATNPRITVERWTENGSLIPTGSTPVPRPASDLRALVGQGPQGDFTLDLRTQGPHALVGGTSGAGKSEFLQAWILGMAAAHSPQRVTFLFVDYKGGSAFADCLRLPHTVGLVTDLSPHLVRRALTSLRAELTYREHLLNAKNAKDLISLEKTGDPDCPPSLVIVVDEFAALVQDVPDFVDGVVDVAQRGRSLGLHLILATQRPAGVIRGNLRANTALRIALRMADEVDSMDVIDSPLAAGFDPRVPGRAAVRTGPGRISLFQSGYAGGRTSDEVGPARIDIETMSFGVGTPWDIPRPEHHEAEDDSTPTDIARSVHAICAAAKICEIPAPRKPWLPELQEHYDLSELLASQGDPTDAGRLLIGIADTPASQSQRPVFFDPDREGNLAIYGTTGSGKSAVLRALAYAAAAGAEQARTEIYAIDFSTAGLSMLSSLPVVGAVIDGSDRERIARLLGRLIDVLEDRSARFGAARAGSITEYRRSAGRTDEARILLLVDGFGAFREEYEMSSALAPVFAKFARLLAEGRAVGIHVLVSAERPNAIPSALVASVQRRLVLRQADENAYLTLGIPRDVLVGAPSGRAVFSGEEDEIQVAIPSGSPSPAVQSEAIEALAVELCDRGVAEAEGVRSLATVIRPSELPVSVESEPVLGIAEATLAPLPFTPQGTFMIAGMPGSGRTSALAAIVESLHRWNPSTSFFFIGPRRSRIHELDLWTQTSRDAEETLTLSKDLLGAADIPAREPSTPDLVLVVEGLADFLNTPADGPLVELFKKLRRNGHLVIGEQETSAWSSGWPLISEIRNQRHGIVLQPNPMDGDLLFKIDLPRIPRADYPLGRGIYVRSGKQWTVQLPLPE